MDPSVAPSRDDNPTAPILPVTPPLPVAPPSSVSPPPEPFVFHGDAREYFRIWIVNTMLTLLTGGLFFAWAKVRKRRYLRGSLELLGHRFDYRADPKRLLIGNLIVVTFFIAYSVFGVVYPAVQVTAVLLGVALLPWVVARAFTFNAHNTVYRGLRFRFHGSLAAATSVYLLQPLAVGVSLGLYYPGWARARRQYVVSNHRLGDAYFRFTANTRPFYFAYLAGAAVFFAATLAGGFVIFLSVLRNGGQPPNWAAMGAFFGLYGLGLFVSRHLIHAQLFNHVWNHTSLDDHRFEARMKTGRWLKLQLTNLLAIIGTAGLLTPWATIRAHRYTASCLSFVPAGPIDRIERMGGKGGSAAGDSAAEVIGMDFGL